MLGGIAKSKDGKYIAMLILLAVFLGIREHSHAQDKDAVLIESRNKTEALLIVCEKSITSKTEIIDSLKDKIADLKMEVAICKLK